MVNVGTQQGQLDGTNGEGLIGIKGNGRETTINNTQTGVINVYADNSWAFGGQTKAIINNGEINLLCDTGCDIYAPGTTGAQKRSQRYCGYLPYQRHEPRRHKVMFQRRLSIQMHRNC